MFHGQDWGDWGELNPPPSVSQTDVQKPLHHKHHRNDSDYSSPFHNDMISLDILAAFLPWGISPDSPFISHPKGIWTPDLLFDRQALWTRLSYEALCFTVHQVSLECNMWNFIGVYMRLRAPEGIWTLTIWLEVRCANHWHYWCIMWEVNFPCCVITLSHWVSTVNPCGEEVLLWAPGGNWTPISSMARMNNSHYTTDALPAKKSFFGISFAAVYQW